MGGAIWVDSEGKVGGGSAFHFMLPAESFAQYLSPLITREIAPLELAELVPEPSNPSISLGHKSIQFSPAPETQQLSLTVLVVDDQTLNLKLCKNMLTTLGYQCILCNNGFDAVKAYEDGLDPLKPEHPRIRVALVDVQMPEMSGTEVYDAMRELEEKYGTNPCQIAMASAAHFAIPHESEDPDRYILNKPFGRKTLDAFIRARMRTISSNSSSRWSPALPTLRAVRQDAEPVRLVRPNLIVTESRTSSEVSPYQPKRTVPDMPNTINQEAD
jgi:CheY-like chemotaxis protein